MNILFCCQRRLGLLALFVLLALGPAHADTAETRPNDYLMGPGDKIHISIFGRSDLSGAYTIRSSGSLSLPVAGEIDASNLTLNQLEDIIAQTYSVMMKTESGPDQAINVNIEIIKHRPFYIIGDVSKPGSYEYESELTVLRAIAIAGGYASSGPDARVNETRARESLNVLMSSYIAGIAREARLIAEREELEEISFPPGLLEMRNDPFVAGILDIELQLFIVRRDLLRQESEIISKRKAQYAEEDKALKAAAAAIERKRAEVDALLKAAKSLSSKGILPKFDLSSFVIMQADVERESRELIVSRSRAKRGIKETEQEALILHGERAREVASELEKISLDLDQTLLHMRAEADRLAILNVKTVSASDAPEEMKRSMVQITRETGDGTVTIDANDNTAVLPGDVVSVPYQEGDVYLSLPGRAQGQHSRLQKHTEDD